MSRVILAGYLSHAFFVSIVLSGSTALPAAANELPELAPQSSRANNSLQRPAGNTDDSPYSAGQLEQLYDQILWQQENGRHAAALESIDKALYLLRIDGGPDNPQQLPLMEKRLHSLQALGHLQEIDQQYQGMLYFYRSQFGSGDVRTANLMGRIAKWQMETFYQLLRNPDEEASGQPYQDVAYTTSIDRRTQAFTMLEQSQLNLIDAISLHVEAGNWPSKDLEQLEEYLLESYYLFAWRDALEDDPDQYLLNRSPRRGSIYKRVDMDAPQFLQAFQQGELVFERLLTYQRQAERENTKPEDEAKVLVALADWHLLFGHKKEALSLYRDATEWLATQPGELTRELDPRQPVLLPTFTHTTAAGSFSTEFVEESDYIDVSFSVTRYGRARDIAITGYSQLQDDQMQKQLLRWLRQCQFRPRLAGNEFNESQLSLRYYYQ